MSDCDRRDPHPPGEWTARDADRDQEKAAQPAAELGPTATPLALDISDAEALARALADVDIVLNPAAPFYRFGREVLSAAIAAGTNYLDICDDVLDS